MPRKNKLFSFLNRTKTKSANNNPERTTLFGLGTGNCLNIDTSPKSLVDSNRNFVYACINKISQYISSVPIHVYYNSPFNTPIITRHKSVPNYVKKQHALNTRIKNTKSIDEDVIEITDIDHPILQFLDTPSNYYSWAEWISLCTSYLMTTGNFICEIINDDNQLQLKPLKWEDIEVINDRNTGEITHYRYAPLEETARTYTPEQVIHIMTRQPGSILTGMGSLEACIDSAKLFEYYDSYQASLARNYGRPGFHINCNVSKNSREDAEAMANEFKRKYSGIKAGEPIVTFGEDVKLTDLSITPKDMEYQVGRDWSKKTICATLGVPEDLVDTNDSNRASSVVALNHFYSVTVYPLLSQILEAINTEFIQAYYDNNAYIYFDEQESLKKDQKQQADILNAYVSSGIMTINEARDSLGLEPLEEEEVEIEIVEEPNSPDNSPSTSPIKLPNTEINTDMEVE